MGRPRKYWDIPPERLKDIIVASSSLDEVLIKLGFDPKVTYARKSILRLARCNGINLDNIGDVQRMQEAKKRYTKENLREAVSTSITLQEVINKLGIVPTASSYKTLNKYLIEYDIDYSHIKGKNSKYNKSGLSGKLKELGEENIRGIVKDSITLSRVLREVGLVARGSNFRTLKKYLNEHNIDTSHFDPNAVRFRKMIEGNKIPMDVILVKDSSYVSTSSLKKRLYNEGMKIRMESRQNQLDLRSYKRSM